MLQVELSLCKTMKMYGEVEVWFHSLISSLGGGERSASHPLNRRLGGTQSFEKRRKSHSLARNQTMTACHPDRSAVIQPNTLHQVPVLSQTQTINNLLSHFSQTHHHISPIYTHISSECLFATILCASLSLDTCAKLHTQCILLQLINIPTGHTT